MMDLLHKIEECLRLKKDTRLRYILQTANLDEVSECIEELNRGKKKTFAFLSPERQAEVLLHLDEGNQDLILEHLSAHDLALVFTFMDDDDTVDFLQVLDDGKKQKILTYLKPSKRQRVEKLLVYHPETAGGLMDFNFLEIPGEQTLKDVSARIKSHVAKTGHTPVVVVVDEGKIQGYVAYKDLLLGAPSTKLSELDKPLPTILYTMDQEQVANLARKERGEEIGVTDHSGKLLGVVHLRDLVKVAEFEGREDLYRFAGVSLEEQVGDPIFTKVKRRSKWLIINLGTAFLASLVVSHFQDSITALSLLAVYMPVVAGQGGNAATQALAVMVRGMALGEIPIKKARRIILKEAIAGIFNGVIVGSLACVMAFLLHAPLLLGVVLGLSMIVNLFIAGLFGSLVPYILKRLRIDPAVASAVFVTTATDIFGFMTFLSLGTLLLIE